MPETPGPNSAENNLPGAEQAHADAVVPAVEAPGPKFDTPTPEEQAAYKQASQEQREAARAAIDSTDNSQTARQALRGRDAEGGNSEWGYNPGDRDLHQLQQKQAAEKLRTEYINTLDSSKGAAAANAEKPTLMGRLRKLFGR